jgi:hypothetical protein
LALHKAAARQSTLPLQKSRTLARCGAAGAKGRFSISGVQGI